MNTERAVGVESPGDRIAPARFCPTLPLTRYQFHAHSVASHVYDSIGDGYRTDRVPERRIAARIKEALGNATTVCNVGAGAGSYEPDDCDVTAVEPSQTMIAQRTSTNRVVRCSAESMPFADGAFDASMAVLTIHHWTNARAGLAEMQRISHRQVVFTFDPEMIGFALVGP